MLIFSKNIALQVASTSLLYLIILLLSFPFSFLTCMQSENDFSLSGVALTALHFDGNYHLLVSGDHSGMVRFLSIFKFGENVIFSVSSSLS